MTMLHWGMIGCGSASRAKGGLGIRRSGKSELVAVADTDEARARLYAAEHGVQRWYADGRELIDDPAVEAVYIAVPNRFHCEYAVAAARAGKHVLCEKPFGTSLEENEQMIEASRTAGVMLAVSYYRRFYPNVQRARETIGSGAIGRLTLAGVHAVSGTVLDEPRRWLIEMDMAGGGALQRSGSHRIDVLTYLLGPVRDVHALSERMLDGYDVEDASVAVLEVRIRRAGVAGAPHYRRRRQYRLDRGLRDRRQVGLGPLGLGDPSVGDGPWRRGVQGRCPRCGVAPDHRRLRGRSRRGPASDLSRRGGSQDEPGHIRRLPLRRAGTDGLRRGNSGLT